MNLENLKLTAKRKQICERLDLKDSDEILHYYPYRYENNVLTPYSSFKENEKVFFEAELIGYPSTFRFGKRSKTTFKVLYEEEYLTIVIFNRPWINNVSVNEKIVIVGKYDGNNKVTATNYYTKQIKEIEGIVAQYPLKEGIHQNEIKKLIESTYLKCNEELVDLLPVCLLNAHQLVSYKEALYNIHFPTSELLLKKALARLKYEEFLRFYLAMDILKGNNDIHKKKKIFDEKKVLDFISSFHFELTPDQNKCVNDILNDLASTKPMYRLVQGEVGCGKTAIAMIALYANAMSGYQGALLAPTEVLAKQHFESLKDVFCSYNLRICLLTGNSEEEKEIKKQIENNEVDIIVGTHALFSQDVHYANLGLVIADEQHRFGVKQRKMLKDKGECVDFISMSATPIPRTLASAVYGDMDVSTIETLPLGRKGCKTYLIQKNSIVDIANDIKEKLNTGRQIYIIGAAIDKNENYEAKDITTLYKSLKVLFEGYQVGLLHGKLTSQEKEDVMNAFKTNKIQVLVSTTVVEVGVNVKNATTMIVYDADRFGLSQLHQLRGRVQRSEEEGTCYLLTNNKDKDVLNRLEVLCRCNNGFDISYEDLKMRGPGDILGTRQSGLPTFILGNFIEDTRFIEAARKDAKYISEHFNEQEVYPYYCNVVNSAGKNFGD